MKHALPPLYCSTHKTIITCVAESFLYHILDSLMFVLLEKNPTISIIVFFNVNMSPNDTEIEIKLPLSQRHFMKIKRILRRTALYKKTTKQIDTYFTPSHRNFVKPQYPFEWFSMRKRGNKTILNYKHFHPENKKIMTHCDEFETQVQNPDVMYKILKALDFSKLVTVEKRRETYLVSDTFEIALDTVTDLGYFIEIEALKHSKDIDKTRTKLLQYAKQLGLPVTHTDFRGYPYLLMKGKKLIS